MSAQQFYIGKKDIEEYAENIEEWICEKIGDPPLGMICECSIVRVDGGSEHEHDGEVACTQIASSYSYRIEGDHIFYTWLCLDCMEATTSDSYLGNIDAIPTTAGGYAVAPQHCT